MINGENNSKTSGVKCLGNKNNNKYCNYDDYKYIIKPISYNSCDERNHKEVAVGAEIHHGCGFRMHSLAPASKLYDKSAHWKKKSFVECQSTQLTENSKKNDKKLLILEEFPNIKFFSIMKIYSKLFSKKYFRFYNIGFRKINMISSSSALSSASSCSSKPKDLKNIVDVPMKKRNKPINKRRTSFLPSLGSTSFITILAFICLETILLSTMSTCAKTFYMHWNTSNSIFRIDNTDHIIDVNKGNLAFEFDQVHIICPVYEPRTFENETEKYIIYNVSKVEYETCRITNADPRVIAICDKPHKLMFFTITFRPFTPQPGGLEFLPGNDYYFISTSSKDDLYRRIGGRCSTNNMKVVFKVCCSAEEKNKTITGTTKTSTMNNSGVESSKTNQLGSNIDGTTIVNNNNGNLINTGLSPSGFLNSNADTNNVNIKPINVIKDGSSLEQFNRIPIQTVGVNSGAGFGNHGGNGILLTPGHGSINMIPNGGLSSTGIGQYPGYHNPGGIRINNMPPQPNYPSHKSTNDDHFEKHPNEVVKNEELTYNSGTSSVHSVYWYKIGSTTHQFATFLISNSLTIILILSKYSQYLKLFLILEFCPYGLMILITFLLIFLLRMWRHHHNLRFKWKFSCFKNGFSATLSFIKYKNKTEFTEVR